jgi:hypothetical protein
MSEETMVVVADEKATRTEVAKSMWADPEKRAKIVAGMRAASEARKAAKAADPATT